MPEKLPEGWVRTTLGEIATPSRQRVLPREVPETPYVGLEHIEPSTMRLLKHGSTRDVRSSSLRFFQGDVLYGKMRPYLNKVWVAEFGGLCSAEFLVFPSRQGLNPYFLARRLNSQDFVDFANGRVSGERPRVDFERLASFPVLLPPSAEQDRIASKLNAALTRIERAERAARRAQERLDRYRDAVRESAVTGEITKAWRDGQPENIESGDALLERILLTRRSLWEQAELARLRAAGQTPRHERWKSRYPVPLLPDPKRMPEFPKQWALATLDQVTTLITKGSSPNWQGFNYSNEGIVFIRSENVRWGSLDLTETVHLSPAFNEKQRKSILEEGDVLLNLVGASIGRAALATAGVDGGNVNQAVAVIRLVHKETMNRFAVTWLLSSAAQRRIHSEKVDFARANFSLENTRSLPIPVPPLAEQSAIVSEVERRFAAAERLASVLGQQLARTRTARQALLREAFAGLLAPQDPSDEPAARLLDRFRTDKSMAEAERRETRRGPERAEPTRGTIMQPISVSTESLREAWQRIGREPDARRLFDEAGCAPEQVIQFYEALRSSDEIRTAFEAGTKKTDVRRKHTEQGRRPTKQPTGRFRVSEIWLEDFRNLKDYTVRFDPAEGTDVVLGWNGTGKSNLFEALVIILRDLGDWCEKNRWPEKPMNGFRLAYEMDRYLVEVTWLPPQMRRPEPRRRPIDGGLQTNGAWESVRRDRLSLPRFVFGYYSGPTNRLAEHFLPMKQAHYDRLREAKADDPETLSELVEQRRFFCAETHHAKYVLLAFSYKEDPKISEFLESRLRIVGFESALFIIREPRWAKPGSKPEDFWGATGIMRRVMERLREHAIAPMVLEQKVSYGYQSTTEDHYYFFLPDLKSLYSFAAEYQDARTFFLALESTDFSELIHDVKIQVRVKATNTEQVSITFHELSEGEQQLLMVLGLMRFTKSHQSLVLLDEPDTHLNPHWSVNYLKDLTSVMSDGAAEAVEQQTSQILIATHDPLVIASLLKEQIHLLKRDPQTGICKWVPASVSPRGLGFTGILTSELFGFRSDLDPETLADLDDRVRLVGKENSLNQQELKKLGEIDRRLASAGFSKAFSDPYYAAFVRAWGRRHSDLMAGQQFLSTQKQHEVDEIAHEVLEEAISELDKETQG